MDYQTLAAEALKKWPKIDPARMEKAVQIAEKSAIVLARFDEEGHEITRPTREAYAVKSQRLTPYDSGRVWYIVRPAKKKLAIAATP